MFVDGISCYCATYGRPKQILENVIQCFLEQDYQGNKELVILNDCKYQKYIFDHPEVKIVNIDEKIPILGIKFNETIKLCKYNFLATWEDDDIFLKNRLSYSIQHLKNNLVFHTHNCFIEKQPQLIQKYYAYCHSTHLIDRNLLESVGLYDELDVSHIDINLISKISNKVPSYTQTVSKISDIFYIYRWHTTHSYHASAVRKERNLSATIEKDTINRVNNGLIEAGTINLCPKLYYNFYDYLPTT